MTRILSNALVIVHLMVFCGTLPCWTAGLAAQDVREKDSIRVEELLIKDTLDLKLNGPSSEITFYLNGMVFLSNSKYHQKMIADHITFGVVKSYFVPLDYISLESSKPLFPNDDFPYSPAGMSFTRDYKKVYFTRPVEIQEKTFVEKVYEMEIIEGKASSYELLPFTSGSSRYLHPAISMDESFMVFSSDRTPSKGGLDLFISKKSSEGWSEPENLGSQINSSSHEWYPFLDHHSNLYFSSSGHMGFGGYDIYVCYFNGSGWDPPQNLSSYINSERDELGFSSHPNKQMAILTRLNEGNSDDEVLIFRLSQKALMASNEGSQSGQKDVTLLLKDLIISGYAEGNYGATALAGSRPVVISAPLIGEAEEKPKAVSEEPPFKAPAKEENAEPESNAVNASALMLAEEEKAAPEPEPDPNQVTFRVQILSNTKANTRTEVTIEGKRYTTFEYYYKGAYRITVGEFMDLDEANAFRIKCKNSGFTQAWVAAFRGNKRETDPSVFRR